MERIHLDCPNCGAKLPAQSPSGQIKCAYCETKFHAAQARAAHTQGGESLDLHTVAASAGALQSEAHARWVGQAAAREIAGVRGGRSVAKPGLVVGVVVVLVLVFVGTRLFQSGLLSSLPGASDFPGAGDLTGGSGASDEPEGASDEYLTYDTVGGPPQPVTIGGETAFVGRTRASHADDQLFIEAYDADTADRHWRIGPLGSYGDARRELFAIHASRVFATDPSPSLRIHDLETGEELEKISLTDRVETICLPPEGKDKDAIWIEQVDERTGLLDLEALRLNEAGRPDWCPASRDSVVNLPSASNAVDSARAPAVDGMRIRKVFVEGDVGVALGVRDPGTPFPMVAGFDPETRALRYHNDLAADTPDQVRARSSELGALENGRFIANYGSGSDAWHVTAFDAETGARLWNTTLRPLFSIDPLDALVASGDHVFIMRQRSVEILSAEDGELLGTVGRESYE